MELTAAEQVAAPVASRSEVERRVTTEELPPEAEAGQKLGEVEVFVEGQSTGGVARWLDKRVTKRLPFRIWYSVRGIANRALEVARQALE